VTGQIGARLPSPNMSVSSQKNFRILSSYLSLERVTEKGPRLKLLLLLIREKNKTRHSTFHSYQVPNKVRYYWDFSDPYFGNYMERGCGEIPSYQRGAALQPDSVMRPRKSMG
jgi:hypothetical protein